MSNAPERIWVQPDLKGYCITGVWPWKPSARRNVREYIRADIHEAEVARLREALEGNGAWLERWAVHVGNCVGGPFCTCGLTLARHENRAALAHDQERDDE